MLQPVQAVDPTAVDASAATDAVKSNLAAVPPTRATVEAGAACVESRIPNLTDSHHAKEFYRMEGNHLWAESELQYMARLDRGSVQNLLQKASELKKLRPDADPALAWATSFREAGSCSWQASERLVESARMGGLFCSGGLNNLGSLPSKYLPPGYRGKWQNEGYGASLPQKDLSIAYGAWLLFSKDEFEKSALKFGFTQRQLDSLSSDARRAWTSVFFAVTGGYHYGARHSDFFDVPGGDTVLTHLQALIAAHKASGLEDILRSPELDSYKIVRLSLAVTANASLLERQMGVR